MTDEWNAPGEARLPRRSVSALTIDSRHDVQLRPDVARGRLLRCRGGLDEFQLRLPLIRRRVVDFLLHGNRELSADGSRIDIGDRIHRTWNERHAGRTLEQKGLNWPRLIFHRANWTGRATFLS